MHQLEFVPREVAFRDLATSNSIDRDAVCHVDSFPGGRNSGELQQTEDDEGDQSKFFHAWRLRRCGPGSGGAPHRDKSYTASFIMPKKGVERQH